MSDRSSMESPVVETSASVELSATQNNSSVNSELSVTGENSSVELSVTRNNSSAELPVIQVEPVQTGNACEDDSNMGTILRRGTAMIEEVEEEIVLCSNMIRLSNQIRRRDIRASAMAGRVAKNAEDLKDVKLSDYLNSIECVSQLRDHIDALEREKEEIYTIAHAHAVPGRECLIEQAEETFRVHKPYIEALMRVSVLGAGLSYSTIFNAKNDNVSQISWAFILFLSGLLVSLLPGLLLKIIEHMHPLRGKIPCQTLWLKILKSLVFIDSLIVIAAIACLIGTVASFSLGVDSNSSSDSDEPVEATVILQPGVWIYGIVFLSSLFYLVFFSFLFSHFYPSLVDSNCLSNYADLVQRSKPTKRRPQLV